MKSGKRILVWLAVLILFSSVALADGYVAAKKLKPSKELYVLDRSDVLTDATKGEIVFSNDLLYKACGAQIAVVTVGTTGNEAIDDYTTELFNAWGVGDAEKGNGFLLLLAIDDDDYYAVCGVGLQPKFTAGALKDYFDRYLEKDFAAKRYDAGVKKFFEAVFARVADTYNADVTVDQGIAAYRASTGGASQHTSEHGGGARGAAEEDDDSFAMILGVLIVIVLVIVLTGAMRRRRARRSVFVAPPPPPPPTVGQGGYRGVDNVPGAGGYRGVDNMPGAGGYRGPVPTPRRSDSSFLNGLFWGMLNASGGSRHSSGSSRRSSGGGGFRSSGGGGFRSSGGSSRSFGGGRSSGGGAGRGRH